MGAQVSKSKTKTGVVNRIITDIMMSNSSNCTANASTEQSLSFSDIKTVGCKLDFSNITQETDISQNLTCLLDTSQTTELQKELETKLKAKAEAQTKGMPIFSYSGTDSTTISKLVNEVVTNIDMSNISTCVANSLSKQSAEFKGITANCTGMDDPTVSFNNIKQILISTQVAECIQKNEKAVKAIDKFENAIDSSSDASTTGVENLEIVSIVSSLCICSVLLLFLFTLMYFRKEIGEAVKKIE